MKRSPVHKRNPARPDIRQRGATLAIGISIAVAIAGLAHVAAARSTGAEGQAAPTTLPPGPGHDIVVRVCSNCHALRVVVKHRLNATEWKNMVDLMVRHGAVASEKERAEITNYLITALPAKPSSGAATPPKP